MYAVLEVDLPVTNLEIKRRICSDLLLRLLAPAQPDKLSMLGVAPQHLRMHIVHMPMQVVLLHNTGSSSLRFWVVPNEPQENFAARVEVGGLLVWGACGSP